MNQKTDISYLLIAILVLLATVPVTAQQENSRSPRDIQTDVITSIDWSPDGLLLATANNNGTIQILDASTREVVHDLITAQANPILTVAWNPAGTQVAATVNEDVYIWERETWQVIHILQGLLDPVWSVTWSPDGTKLAGVSNGRQPNPNFIIWGANSGKQIQTMEYPGTFYKAAWSPDGHSLATTGGNRVQLWDVSQTTLQDFLTKSGQVVDAKWSPDGTRLAVVGEHHIVFIWEIASKEVVLELTGHQIGIPDLVFGVDWSPDGSKIASAATDGTVRVWDAATGEALNVIEVGGEAFSVAWSPDGSQLAYGAENNVIGTAIAAPTPNTLQDKIIECVTDKGIQTSLLAKVNAGQWQSIINEVEALESTQVTPECAAQIVEMARYFIDNPPGEGRSSGKWRLCPVCSKHTASKKDKPPERG